MNKPQGDRQDLWEIYEILLEIREMMKDPAVHHLAQDIIEDMWELMSRKGEDYSGHANHTFRNFELSADLTGRDVDSAFVQLMATKFARLVSLTTPSRRGNRKANFETVEDTWVDLANYIVLFVAYKKFSKGDQS